MSIGNYYQLDTNKKNRLLEVVIMVSGGMFFFWCVFTSSLPYVFAVSNPEFALWLNANNPTALLSVAERARQNLFELTEPEVQIATSTDTSERTQNHGQEPIAGFSKSDRALDKNSIKIRALYEKIETFAVRAAIDDPRNARAFRFLAEVADSPDATRYLMIEAFKRSRRMPIATLWLMADSFHEQHFEDVVKKADILLRTQPQIAQEVMDYLGRLAAIPEGRLALISMLAKQPDWRAYFWEALPKNVRHAGTPYELMIELQDVGNQLTAAEVAPYLNVLVKVGLVSYAHQVWRTLLDKQNRTHRQLLENADFSENLIKTPFDWSIQNGQNVTYQIQPEQSGNRRSVQFQFGVGRIKFPAVSQLVMLDSGQYRFSGQTRGNIRAKRGLRWEVRCWQGQEIVQSEMLFGGEKNFWRNFHLRFQVPKSGCNGIEFRLIHDSRSTSEMFISGYISFRHLTLTTIASVPN